MAQSDAEDASLRIQFADNIQPAQPLPAVTVPFEKGNEMDLEERARRLTEEDFHEKKKQVRNAVDREGPVSSSVALLTWILDVLWFRSSLDLLPEHWHYLRRYWNLAFVCLFLYLYQSAFVGGPCWVSIDHHLVLDTHRYRQVQLHCPARRR